MGTGASSAVHLAYDVQTDQQLACKVYDLGAIKSQVQLDMTLRGVELSAQLDHPNIARFKKAYKSKHTMYVFEEMATGGDLFSMAVCHRLFTEAEVCWMMRQILCAVDHIHKQGIMHRDIKTENVVALISPTPSRPIALTDFGHANMAGRPHRGVGTPGW